MMEHSIFLAVMLKLSLSSIRGVRLQNMQRLFLLFWTVLQRLWRDVCRRLYRVPFGELQ